MPFSLFRRRPPSSSSNVINNVQFRRVTTSILRQKGYPLYRGFKKTLTLRSRLKRTWAIEESWPVWRDNLSQPNYGWTTFSNEFSYLTQLSTIRGNITFIKMTAAKLTAKCLKYVSSPADQISFLKNETKTWKLAYYPTRQIVMFVQANFMDIYLQGMHDKSMQVGWNWRRKSS